MTSQTSQNPIATVFAVVGAVVGLGYGGYIAGEANVDSGTTLLTGFVGMVAGALLGKVIGNFMFRVILVALVVFEIVAHRMIWAGFWNGVAGT